MLSEIAMLILDGNLMGKFSSNARRRPQDKHVWGEEKISFDFSSIIWDVHMILNLTMMSVGTKKLEVFILYDLCYEVFS